jgi:hypothetical protein
MWDMRGYLREDAFKTISKRLELDDSYGNDFYLEHVLGEELLPLPVILMELQKRAVEKAGSAYGLSQPNSADAKAHFFIRSMSGYFLESYGQRLHAHVAAITRVTLGSDVDEDNVRALIRAKDVSTKSRARKKMQQLRREIDG